MYLSYGYQSSNMCSDTLVLLPPEESHTLGEGAKLPFGFCPVVCQEYQRIHGRLKKVIFFSAVGH